MATYDRERREVVVRIVYDGAATAGKTENLRSLHASFNHRAEGDVYAPAVTASGRTLYFDWLELQAGQVDDWPLRCEVVTVPGQLVLADRRFHLLRALDAAVFVCESSRRGVTIARRNWQLLGRLLQATGNGEVPVVIQANKQDLPDALTPQQVERLLVPGQQRTVYPASAQRGEGVRTTFLAALDAARGAVRERLRIGGPESLPQPLASREQLYDAMVAGTNADADPALTAALDEALASDEGRALRRKH